MADPSAKVTTNKSRRRLTFLTIGVVAITALGIVLPAALLLVAVGIIPSATAYLTDRSPLRTAFRTVLPLNLAGVSVYVAALWHGDGSIATATEMLRNPVTWLVMYASAGAGSLLHFVMPVVVTVVLRNRLQRQRTAQEQLIEDMRAEWGQEVCPEPDPDKAVPP